MKPIKGGIRGRGVFNKSLWMGHQTGEAGTELKLLRSDILFARQKAGPAWGLMNNLEVLAAVSNGPFSAGSLCSRVMNHPGFHRVLSASSPVLSFLLHPVPAKHKTKIIPEISLYPSQIPRATEAATIY